MARSQLHGGRDRTNFGNRFLTVTYNEVIRTLGVGRLSAKDFQDRSFAASRDFVVGPAARILARVYDTMQALHCHASDKLKPQRYAHTGSELKPDQPKLCRARSSDFDVLIWTSELHTSRVAQVGVCQEAGDRYKTAVQNR